MSLHLSQWLLQTHHREKSFTIGQLSKTAHQNIWKRGIALVWTECATFSKGLLFNFIFDPMSLSTSFQTPHMGRGVHRLASPRSCSVPFSDFGPVANQREQPTLGEGRNNPLCVSTESLSLTCLSDWWRVSRDVCVKRKAGLAKDGTQEWSVAICILCIYFCVHILTSNYICVCPSIDLFVHAKPYWHICVRPLFLAVLSVFFFYFPFRVPSRVVCFFYFLVSLSLVC